MKSVAVSLTEIEDSTLSDCEQRIARNEAAAIDYLDAFRTIRDQRLYRDEFKTFADYCQSKWAKSYRAINLNIEADSIRKELVTASPEMGKAFSQISDATARTMKKIKPQKRAAVLKKAAAVSGLKPITPTLIRSVATQRDYSSVYTSPKADPVTPQSPVNPVPAQTTLPTISNPTSAAAFLTAYYEANKPWFNDISTGKPRTPREILDRFLKALQSL